MMQIQESLPSAKPQTTLYEHIGGEPVVQAIVTRFYDLMELEPQFTVLRAVHGATLDEARKRLFWFLCGWMGGPQYYTDQFGHPRLKMRHMPFKIGTLERDQWLACMAFALQDCGVQDPLHTRLMESFFGTADWMRNTDG
jgi:hemoglobin